MKKILVIASFILIIISTTIIGYSMISANSTVNEVENILASQHNKETYLTPYGYTLDNPNIIINPYGISPLSAIILFETEEYLPVTITIQGKDQNSTYTNTFEENNRHYIPVYGLYPNTINYIKLECGNEFKNIEIKTEPLPNDLIITEITTNNTNNLTFITSNNYPYALDNNNEVRWYLTKKYSKKIDYLENGHLLLSDEVPTYNELSNNLVEIDLLGKIYKQYILDSPYLGEYEETTTSLIIKSTKEIELDKQTGTIINKNTSIEKSTEVLSELTSRTITHNNEYQNLLPLYTNNQNYQLTKSQKINLTKETKVSNNNIFLVGYIEPDENYNNYNININKTPDNIQITGNFNDANEAYIILDKFLDKKIYNLNNNNTIINKQGLSGKYSIYIKLNDTIYKTDNYIKF